MESVFVETKNAIRIIGSTQKTVKNGGCLVVSGDPGSGKSAIYNELSGSLAGNYNLVDVMAGSSSDNRVGFYCKLLIQAVNPDLKVPGAIELKFKLLRDCFISASAKNKRTVLLVDEAQNLSLATIRGLKNIREQSRVMRDGKNRYMLSIIFFCKNYHNFLDNFISRDPGDRFIIEEMELLDADESLAIAKEVFGMKFENKKAKSSFLEFTSGYASAIEKLYFQMEKEGFEGIVTENLLSKTISKQLKDSFRKHRITNGEIVEFLADNDIKASVSEVNESLKGKEGSKADSIREAAKQFLKSKGIES